MISKRYNNNAQNINQPYAYDQSARKSKNNKYFIDSNSNINNNKSDRNEQQYKTTVDRLMGERRISRQQKQNCCYQNINNRNCTSSHEFQLNGLLKKGQGKQKGIEYGDKQVFKPNRRYAYIKTINSQRQNQQSTQKITNYDINISPNSKESDSQSPKYSNLKNYQVNRLQHSKINYFTTTKKMQHQRLNSQIDIDRDYNHNYHQIKQSQQVDRIKQLQRLLQQQKYKFKVFQQQTIDNQVKVLQTINNMEMKLKTVHQQNLLLRQKNQQLLKSKQTHSQINQLKDMLEQKQNELLKLTKQHKKIKDIGRGIVEMMKKVDLIEVPPQQDQVKFAWRWLKKVVWEYEGIRKKALTWKVAYEQLNQDSIDSQDC